MKQRKLIAAVFSVLFAGQALALDQAGSEKFTPTADSVPVEITLQHEFVEQFKLFDDPRYLPLSKIIRGDARRLNEPGMIATITARDEVEASLVADTYRRYGATVNFAKVIDPVASLVTINIR